MPAEVEFVTYLGSLIRYILRLESGHTVISEAPNVSGRPEFGLGEKVHVVMKAQDFVLIP